MSPKKPETGLTRREVLLWLVSQDEDEIRAVLMAVGRDAEMEELELHGEAGELVAQLEGPLPRLESIVVAIEDALGIDEAELGRRVRGECEEPAEDDLEDLEVDLDVELDPDEDGR